MRIDLSGLIDEEIKAAGILELDETERRTMIINTLRKWAVNLGHNLDEASNLLDDIIYKEYYFDKDHLDEEELDEYVNRLQSCLTILGVEDTSYEWLCHSAVDAANNMYDGCPDQTNNEPYEDYWESDELKNYKDYCVDAMTRRTE